MICCGNNDVKNDAEKYFGNPGKMNKSNFLENVKGLTLIELGEDVYSKPDDGFFKMIT